MSVYLVVGAAFTVWIITFMGCYAWGYRDGQRDGYVAGLRRATADIRSHLTESKPRTEAALARARQVIGRAEDRRSHRSETET